MGPQRPKRRPKQSVIKIQMEFFKDSFFFFYFGGLPYWYESQWISMTTVVLLNQSLLFYRVEYK